MGYLFKSLGSTRIRLAVGLLLAVLLMVLILGRIDNTKATATPQPPPVYNPGEAPQDKRVERLVHLAKTDHVALLKLCLDNYRKSYRNYTCRMDKLERLGDKMTPLQLIDIKFMDRPFSVVMTWQQNAAGGDKMLYVEDPKLTADKWQMYIHPSGLPGRFLKSVERSPDDPQVRASSLRSVKEFGFERNIESLIKVYEEAKANGNLVEASYLGINKEGVDGRPTLGLRRVLPNGHNYPAKVTIIDIDQEYLVPVRVRGTNWQDQPLCDYVYTNLKFNTDLTERDFTRKANNLD
jgi:hypothetical protein